MYSFECRTLNEEIIKKTKLEFHLYKKHCHLLTAPLTIWIFWNFRKMLEESWSDSPSSCSIFAKHICPGQWKFVLQCGLCFTSLLAWFNWEGDSWWCVCSWTCNNTIQLMLSSIERLSIKGCQVYLTVHSFVRILFIIANLYEFCSWWRFWFFFLIHLSLKLTHPFCFYLIQGPLAVVCWTLKFQGYYLGYFLHLFSLRMSLFCFRRLDLISPLFLPLS